MKIALILTRVFYDNLRNLFVGDHQNSGALGGFRFVISGISERLAICTAAVDAFLAQVIDYTVYTPFAEPLVITAVSN